MADTRPTLLQSDGAIALGVAIAAVGLYGATLLPGLGGSGDTAKFQFVGKVLGIPHPPGYPLYMLLSHAVSRLPMGSLAWRMNAFSALSMAAALGLVYLAVRQVGISRPVALVAAGLLAVSREVWTQAVVAEVYALNAFFIAATILSLAAWVLNRSFVAFVATMLVYGLSAAHHQTIVALMPALGVTVLTVGRRQALTRRGILTIILGAALGAAFYAYIPWRLADPHLAYTELPRPASLSDIVMFITGGSFRSRLFAFSLTEILTARLSLYGVWLTNQISPLGVVLGVVGWGWLAVHRRALAVILGLAWLTTVMLPLSYDTPSINDMFIPSAILWIVALASGVDVCASWLRRRLGRRGMILVGLAALATALPWIYAAYRYADRSSDMTEALSTQRLVAHLPQGSVVVFDGSMPDGYRRYELAGYLLFGESRRPDVRAILAVFPAQVIKAYQRGDPAPPPDQGLLFGVSHGRPITYVGLNPQSLVSQGLHPRAQFAGRQRLPELLQGLASDTLVVLAAHDGPFTITEDLRRSLDRCGLSPGDSMSAYVGVGIPGGSGLQQVGLQRASLRLPAGTLLPTGTRIPTSVEVASLARGALSRSRLVLQDARQGNIRALLTDLRAPTASVIAVNKRKIMTIRPGLNVALVDARTGEVQDAFTADPSRAWVTDEILLYTVTGDDGSPSQTGSP